MPEWIAEKVKFSQLKPNGAFYLTNPLKTVAFPHYTCEDLAPDTEVWTLYSSCWRYNVWLEPTPEEDEEDEYREQCWFPQVVEGNPPPER